jgi:hypothetical protein
MEMTEAKQAVEQGQEKAQEVAGKAGGMVREQLDQRSSQAGEKVSGTAHDLRSVGEELRNQGKETPAKLAEKAAERTERFGSYLSESNGDRLLEDIEDLGRRQPMLALAGGVALGLVAARFLKASSESRYRSRYAVEGPPRELAETPPTAHDPAPVVPAPRATPPPQVPVGADATPMG